jgi:hypothetical protein
MQSKQNIHLHLRELVVSEAKVELVEPKGFTINLPSVGAPVAIRAEGDEVVILVRLTLRPRDNVMNIDLDIPAGGNGAAVPGLNQDAAPEFSGYRWAPIPK